MINFWMDVAQRVDLLGSYWMGIIGDNVLFDNLPLILSATAAVLFIFRKGWK